VDPDNNSVIVMNTSAPASMLKKKSNLIAYHDVQWVMAMDKICVMHISSETNVANILTKPLPGGAKWDLLVRRVLHDIVTEVTPMIDNACATIKKVLSSTVSFPWYLPYLNTQTCGFLSSSPSSTTGLLEGTNESTS
jgi:hypothetical protein